MSVVDQTITPPTLLETLNRIEPWIITQTRKQPRFWRNDLQQELRLYTIINHIRATKHQKAPNIGLIQMELQAKLKSFIKLERNHGIKYTPDNIDYESIENSIVHDNYNIHQKGLKLIINNRLNC